MPHILTNQFLDAYRAGAVCLHPTDSLPGLTFDPRSEKAREALYQWKGRDALKPTLSLVANVDLALKQWLPLPGAWEDHVRKLWPASLSVVWKASRECPPSLHGPDGTVALRVPVLTNEIEWFRDGLRILAEPVPTSSVNRSGEPAASTWREALQRTRGSGIFCPEGIDPTFVGAPSTVIRILEDGRWKLLREGNVTVHRITAVVGEPPC